MAKTWTTRDFRAFEDGRFVPDSEEVQDFSRAFSAWRRKHGGRDEEYEDGLKSEVGINAADSGKRWRQVHKEIVNAQEELRKKLEELKKAKAELDQKMADGTATEEEIKRYSVLKDQISECNEEKKKLSDDEKTSGFKGRIDAIDKGLDEVVNNLKDAYRHIQHMVDPWAAADRAASKYAKTVAMTKAGMDKLRRTTIDNVVHSKLGINYNISTEELLEAQQNYVQSVGRSLRIDNTQQESLAAMHAVMGGRENELAVALENFGVSLNGTADHVGKMFAEASQEGLSFEKYSDNVAKNIKIAQNYTFKNGLKGLESMAKKATAIKMDMGQIASLADRVSSIEGSVGVASKLQVLGGPFASAADPLGMMVEGLTDMEGLTDRITKMIGGLGKFNMETGEVEVSAFNKQRIKAASEAMGISYDQLMESVHASERRNQISKQIDASATASKFDDKMKELLKNSGTFENGKAGISVNGEFKSIDELTNEDYDELVKETQDQAADIKDIARNLRSITDIEEGTKKQYRANKAKITEETGSGERLKKIVDFVGHSNFLLEIIAFGSFTKDIIGITRNIYGAFSGVGSTFRGPRGGGGGGFGRFGGAGRNAGRFGNGIGSGLKKYGTYSNRIGRSKWFKGTKFGDAMRRMGAKSYKFSGKVNAKSAQLFSKFTGKFGKYVGKFGKLGGKFGKYVGNFGKLGGKFGTGALQKLAYEKVGTVALSAIQKLGGAGANLAAKSGIVGKAGTAIFNAAAGAESKLFAKAGVTAAKGLSTKAVGETVGKMLLKGAGRGAGTGMLLGIASAGVEMGRDALVQRGKIKKGGTADSLMTIASEQAKWAGFGTMFGGVGAAIGAAIGTFTGLVKATKRKREVKLDNKLEQMGIQRKGEYRAHGYKLINKALDTGEISNRMRKKLEKKGDTAMLEAIDKKKEEIREKKRKEKNERLAAIFGGGGRSAIARGHFKVGTAYITASNINGSGLGFGGTFGHKIHGVGNLGIGKVGLGMSNLFGFSMLFNKIKNIKGKPETGDNKDTSKLLTTAKNLIGKDISSFGNLKTNANQKSSPMDVNINGTIRLVGANGQEVDITDELINDHNFIRALTNKITEQMGDNRVGSNRQDNNAMGRML